MTSRSNKGFSGSCAAYGAYPLSNSLHPILIMPQKDYHYFLTLDREISLIWASRWNVIEILFLLTRYMPRVSTQWVYCSASILSIKSHEKKAEPVILLDIPLALDGSSPDLQHCLQSLCMYVSP